MSDTQNPDDRPCRERGWCDPRVPACDCGRVWEYRAPWGTYVSADVVNSFRALYGEPKTGPFVRTNAMGEVAP